MGHFFNIDNVFFRAMSKLFDAVILSVVFTVVCIPIVTVGPAITGLYYSTVKNMRRNRSYVLKEFFHSFKSDFKQSFLLQMILYLVGAVLYMDLKLSVEGQNVILSSLRYFYLIISVLAAFIAIYAFPLISRFQLKMSVLLRLALFLSIRHFLTTVVCAILLFGGFAAVYMTNGLAFALVPVFVSYLISILMEKVLKSCMKMVVNDEEKKNQDEWYME